MVKLQARRFETLGSCLKSFQNDVIITSIKACCFFRMSASDLTSSCFHLKRRRGKWRQRCTISRTCACVQLKICDFKTNASGPLLLGVSFRDTHEIRSEIRMKPISPHKTYHVGPSSYSSPSQRRFYLRAIPRACAFRANNLCTVK